MRSKSILRIAACVFLAVSLSFCTPSVPTQESEPEAESSAQATPATTKVLSERIVTISSVPTQLRQVEQKRGEYLRFSAGIGQLAVRELETSKGRFTRLDVPGFQATTRVGAPSLPVMNQIIAIPSGSIPRVEVISASPKTLHLKRDLGISERLFPCQPSAVKCGKEGPEPLLVDERAYEVDSDLTLANIEVLGSMRGVTLARVELAPVQYRPSKGEVTVFENIELQVTYKNEDATKKGAKLAPVALDAGRRSTFFEPVLAALSGYEPAATKDGDLVRGIARMVLVGPQAFLDSMQDFVAWKTDKGIEIIPYVVPSFDPNSSTEAETVRASIQAFIRDEYNAGTPEKPSPSFILLVGDVQQVPTFVDESDYTDRPYAAIDDDLLPDIYYGRISAQNPEQLRSAIDKTLAYEKLTIPDTSYLANAVMVGGMDSSYGPVWANGQINYATTYYINAAHDMNVHTYLYPDSGSQSPAIIRNIADGVGFANYTAHCSPDGWANPAFRLSDISALDNVGKYGFIIGNCCQSSSYQVDESFSERILRAADEGAIGYIGASNSSYWDEDYWWGVGSGSIVEHPTYEGTTQGAYDGLFHEHGEARSNWFVTADAMIFSGNLAVMAANSSRVRYYWNIYNLSGDPSLIPYVGVPTTNPVQHLADVYTTAVSFPVQALAASYVGLTQGGRIIGVGTTDSVGRAEIPLAPGSLVPGSARLVVTAQNKIPYIADIHVALPVTVSIQPSAIDAEVTSEVEVEVLDPQDGAPRPNVEVWAEGYGYKSAVATTDTRGRAVLSITYPFGPSVEIKGKVVSETQTLFSETLTVRASPLPQPDLRVVTDIGLDDAFALGFEGRLVASVDGAPLSEGTLWAFAGRNELGSTHETQWSHTPTQAGLIRGVLSVPGHDVYSEEFPIVRAVGRLSGRVTANGQGIAGLTLFLRSEDGSVQVEVTTDANGEYNVGRDVPVGTYSITGSLFGYRPIEESYFMHYGPNRHDVTGVPTSRSALRGRVTDSDGSPLAATIRVYHPETGRVFASTQSSETDGTYRIDLPSARYDVAFRAPGYILLGEEIEVATTETVYDASLSVTSTDVLVITDWTPPAPESALIGDLHTLGLSVVVETPAETDPTRWNEYGLVVFHAGNSAGAFYDAELQRAWRDFALNHGRFLVEGGEVLYGLNGTGSESFRGSVLHLGAWDSDSAGPIVWTEPGHTVLTSPNGLVSPIPFEYSSYLDADCVTPSSDATWIAGVAQQDGCAAVHGYSAEADAAEGDMVALGVNYEAISSTVRRDLLENILRWLGVRRTEKWQRTVVFIYGATQPGQDMFVRGGLDHGYAERVLGRRCTEENGLCAIPMRHRNLRNATTRAQKGGDTRLDWYGPQARQPVAAVGSPLDWTTNLWPREWGSTRSVAVDGYGEEPLNQMGHHYWMLDVDMDCSATVNGWFEVKSFISNGAGWERDVRQPGAPYESGNHFAECGKINVFRRNEDGASIRSF